MGGDHLVLEGKKNGGTLGYFAMKNNKIGIIGNQHYLKSSVNVNTVMVRRECSRNIENGHRIAVGTVDNVLNSYEHGLDCSFVFLNESVRREVKLRRNKVVHGVIKDHLQLQNVTDEDVYFCGSVTDFREAVLKSGSAIVRDIKDEETGDTFKPKNVIRLSRPCEKGDSGALVVTKKGDVAVGLIFARNNIESFASCIFECEALLKIHLICKGQ